MLRKVFGEGPSDPFQLSSILDQGTPIGYQTRHFALLLAGVKSFTISSAALSTAPGGPRSLRTSSNPRLISSPRFFPSSEADGSFTSSAATRRGVKPFSVNSATTDRPAA